ncbi:MAG TPA: amino acid adenylation domain-containing protein, partial [Longimicrobium sp.]|nr:amino acid adenylation domain-containing protein [Longimicrobium sp.]
DPAAPLDRTWRGSVPEIFARRAAERPKALAVEDPRERWTYAELDAATARIARRLVEGGVRPGDTVAIFAHRSAAMVRAMLGVLRAGAAFVALDPAYPAARLAEYVRIAAPRGFLRIEAAGPVPSEVEEALSVSATVTIELGSKSAEGIDGVDGWGSMSPDAVGVEIGPDSLAYLSFTSGTTGAPKAVMGRHGSLTHFTPWLAEHFGLTAEDRFSLLSGLAHDPLHRDVFTPLQLGASVVAPDPDSVGTPGYLSGWAARARITVAHLTPAMGQLLAGAGDEDAAAGSLPTLRRAFFVGDVLMRGDVARLRRLAPNVTVVNYYGSTETQRAVSFHVVDPDADAKPIVPLGRGIPGVQLLVRTQSGALAGVGELGEVWLRSPHVALGYRGDAELTASRFVRNPWTEAEGDWLYRTGDLGRYTADGEVEPAGRADQQVKVRGFRIELGEVEAALAKHHSVRQAAVVTRGEGEDRALVAYVVPAADVFDADALRAHLKSALPEFMVPSAFVRMEVIPLTANGKLDRRALPEPTTAAPVADAPLTETEEAVAAIWREVLGIGPVRASDDFFSVGGHSLRATQVLSRIQSRLGVTLPVRAFFAAPTLAGLAAAVDAARPREMVDKVVAAPAALAYPPGVYPLSFAQQRLWMLMQLGTSTAYNVTDALRFRGPLDDRVLEYALTEVVRRHEPLRTRVELRDGEPVQVVLPARPIRLRAESIDAEEGEARDAEYTRRVEAESAVEFPEEGPFLRVRLFSADDEDHVLCWTVHHMMTDGWSQGIVRTELLALYAAFAADEGSPLEELPTTFGRYALRQREELGGDALERLAAWWRGRMAGAPELLELPTDRPRPPEPSGVGESLAFTLLPGRGRRVEELARERGATPFMVLLAAFQAVLGRWSGQDDVVVGTPIANRTRPELEGLVGFFANTLALRGDLSGDPSFAALVDRAREMTLGAYEHQDLPFEKLVEELRPERSMSHAPVFQVMLVLQNAPVGGGGGDGGEITDIEISGVARGRRTAAYDLSLALYEWEGGYFGMAEYATELFDPSTIERLMGQMDALLSAALDAPEAPLSLLPPLTDDDLDAERALSAGPAPDPDAQGTILDRISARAAEAPDAVAVEAEDGSLTFGEMEARAATLAAFLRAHGIGAESRVAIAMERGTDVAVAMLGVMKAGAAYVPVDFAYPAERIEWMLADSGATVVLTHSSTISRLPETGALVVAVDSEWERIAVADADLPAVEIDPANAAYVIYTSGSTGRPKGVVIPHVGLANLADEHVALVGLRPGDRMLQVASLSFDMSVEEIFPTWAAGATVVFRPADLPDGEGFSRLVEERGITLLDPPTAFFHEWMRALEEGAPFPRTLRLCVIGGERVREDAVAAWTRLAGGARLLNSYGPTETTVTATTYEARAGADPRAPVPIGCPVGGTRAYVLDRRMRPVPAGVPGELYLGGAGVARGYLGRPALTAAVFVPDELSGVPGARMYRTGDRVRRRVDGELEFLGRVDEQVKVRGFRVEPGEIESVLRAFPGVRDAVVVARGEGAAKRLAAYLTPAGVDAAALRKHAAAHLPEYMVPSAFTVLDVLPMTPGGKVDRRSLPEPDFGSGAGWVAPRTPTEEMVAGIWAELLGVERVGAEDGFFDLGGHSLLATRLVTRVREAFGVQVPMRVVFEDPRLARFAARVDAALRAGAEGGEGDAEPPVV